MEVVVGAAVEVVVGVVDAVVGTTARSERLESDTA